MTDGRPYRIEHLTKKHDRSEFDCNEPTLNEFLIKFAMQNQREDNSRTFVAIDTDDRLCGYYSMTTGNVAHEHAPAAVIKRQPRYPIPVLVIARLAVANDQKGKGLGYTLLIDALRRAVMISENAGVRAVMVEALHERAASFYDKFGFEASPNNSMRLFLTMKTVRQRSSC